MIVIYGLYDPLTSRIRYVGKTNNPRKRLNRHLSNSKFSKVHSSQWIKSLIDKGYSPEMIILQETDEATWKEDEKRWIEYYKNLAYDLTNILPGGEGGATYGRLGKKNSPEHIKKSSDGRRGRSVKRNPESNKRRAEGVQRYWDSNKTPVYQYTLEGIFVMAWDSSVDAGKSLGINYSNINACCKGKKRRTKEFQWSYECFDKIEAYTKPSVWNKDKHMSTETKEKIRKSRKGKKWSNARRLAQRKV